MQEKWIKWEPLPGLSQNYYLKSFIEDDGAIEIVFGDGNREKPPIKMKFGWSVFAFQWKEEVLCLNMIVEFNKISNFYSTWTFFYIENSKYIEKLIEDSHGITERYGLKHLVFFMDEGMLEIVTTDFPEVILLEKDFFVCDIN